MENKHKEFKVGDNVKVLDIYDDHPVHRDEDSGESPKKTALKNLKRFKGLVGTITDITYENCYESFWMITVKFGKDVEEYFSEFELELTTEYPSTEVPKALKVVDFYSPLTDSERITALDILKSVISSPSMCDKVLTDKAHYIEECIELAIKFSKQVDLEWYRGQKEVKDE